MAQSPSPVLREGGQPAVCAWAGELRRYHSGVVFEEDLGSRTARFAERMTSFNPDQTWKKVAVSAPSP
jgi:hypothetical protein